MNRKEARQHQADARKAQDENDVLVVNLPTGSGKSLIQSRCILDDILISPTPGVYVVLAPRILLATQLFSELKVDMALNNVDAQYLIVNSGNRNDSKADLEWFESVRKIEMEAGIPYREVPNTTQVQTILDTYQKAQAENVPLIIVGNYQSAEKISKANLPVKQLHADEAHYLVPGVEQENDLSSIVVGFKAVKKYYYTATMKFTNGQLGMNNQERFGPVFSRLPVELINAGELVRPRMHLVDIVTDKDSSEEEKDAIAIEDAFREHRMMLAEGAKTLGAKILITAKGSVHLDKLVKHPKLIALREDRPNLRIFDISSANGARINEERVTREEFLKALRGLKDDDEAIVIHVRILTEGIDVPGITGIMPLNNLKKSSFLQTLGRATRLHLMDRSRLYAGSLEANALKRFVKPYAWVIIPAYDDLGEEMKATFTEMVRDLRTFGFKPSEDVFVSTSKGARAPVAIGTTTDPDHKEIFGTNAAALIYEVEHTIEEEETANHIDEYKQKIKKACDEDIAAALICGDF